MGVCGYWVKYEMSCKGRIVESKEYKELKTANPNLPSLFKDSKISIEKPKKNHIHETKPL